MKRRYALGSLLSWLLCATLFAVELFALGVFSEDSIVVTTLATTGPDYKVVLGQSHLAVHMPDTLGSTDVNGVMVTGQAANELGKYLEQNYQAFGDYFVLRSRMVGVAQSDSANFHPLLEVVSWTHVNKLLVGILAAVDIVLFVLSQLFYGMFKRTQG